MDETCLLGVFPFLNDVKKERWKWAGFFGCLFYVYPLPGGLCCRVRKEGRKLVALAYIASLSAHKHKTSSASACIAVSSASFAFTSIHGFPLSSPSALFFFSVRVVSFFHSLLVSSYIVLMFISQDPISSLFCLWCGVTQWMIRFTCSICFLIAACLVFTWPMNTICVTLTSLPTIAPTSPTITGICIPVAPFLHIHGRAITFTNHDHPQPQPYLTRYRYPYPRKQYLKRL